MKKPDLAAVLIGKAKPMGAEKGEEDSGELDMVAEDLIAAVKAADASGVAAALKAAHGICAADYADEE